MGELEQRLLELVREALAISDLIGRTQVAIGLNTALVALDGVGDAGPARFVAEDIGTA